MKKNTTQIHNKYAGQTFVLMFDAYCPPSAAVR
jgi:hypothetical protein